MSMVTCQRCSRHVDSDFDLDCFVDGGDHIACERCRERMEDAGELDVETNTTLYASKKIGGETFAQFVARMESEPQREEA